MAGTCLKAHAVVRSAALRIRGETARLDAELIVASALGIDRETLLLGDHDVPDMAEVERLIARRIAGEPVAYITGRQAFWSFELDVTPDVLIPRADTETLVEAALRHFTDRAPRQILDLGTGSGALIIAMLCEWPLSQGTATDISEAALDIARRNAGKLGITDRCRFLCADWDSGISGRFDLIVSNPPYIGDDEEIDAGVRAHEPVASLFAGNDGLDAYRRIIPALPHLLARGGFAILEIGHLQAEAVLSLGLAAGLCGEVRSDLAGRDRAIAFQAV